MGIDCHWCNGNKVSDEIESKSSDTVREFDTGATRSADKGKLKYEGFLSPIVLLRFAVYMHKHRVQPDGTLREPDNWQKGIPDHSAIDSMLRHVFDTWLHMRGYPEDTSENLNDSLCAIIFNASVMLLNLERREG